MLGSMDQSEIPIGPPYRVRHAAPGHSCQPLQTLVKTHAESHGIMGCTRNICTHQSKNIGDSYSGDPGGQTDRLYGTLMYRSARWTNCSRKLTKSDKTRCGVGVFVLSFGRSARSRCFRWRNVRNAACSESCLPAFASPLASLSSVRVHDDVLLLLSPRSAIGLACGTESLIGMDAELLWNLQEPCADSQLFACPQ